MPRPARWARRTASTPPGPRTPPPAGGSAAAPPGTGARATGSPRRRRRAGGRRRRAGPRPRSPGDRLLGADGGATQGQGAEQPDQEGDQDAEVGIGPVAVLAAQADDVEEVALPAQPPRVGVGHQAPADDGADEEQCQRHRLHAAVAAAGVEQVRLGVVRFRSARSASMIPHQAAIGTPSVIRKPWNWKKNSSATKTTATVPMTMSAPSIVAATGRGTRRPAASSDRPDE